MLEKFLEYIEIEKRYSPHTLKSYQKDLTDFSLFVLETEGTNDLRVANKKVVRNFMVRLSEKGLSKRSINRKLSALRSFYLFLLKIGEIKTSPLESIPTLKNYPEKQIPLSLEEVGRLREVLQDQKKQDLLGGLIVEVLYQTGMRRSELCQIKKEDVDFSKNEFLIHGKGNKERIVPFSKELGKELVYYKDFAPEVKDSVYFFHHPNGKKLSEKFVYSVVKKYLSMVTTKQKKSPHILRHSFATHVLGNGAEISKVKAILGHSSLASTQVYTDANIETLKKVFQSAHPRARKGEKE